ncbi:MAG: ABC transporter substrate-binding protein, partial [Chloroflexota bacterium]
VGYRQDAFEKANLPVPDTFDALQETAKKMQTSDVGFFVTQNNLHWIYPNWLISYGGNFFKDPPKDLTPTLDSPEAVQTVGMFADLLSKYSVPGGANLDTSVAQTTMHQGKGMYYLDGMGNVQSIIDKTKTEFADMMAFGNTPKGPKGHFPQLAVHGFCIPKNAKNKKASWELIKWAVSKDMTKWQALEKNHLATCRISTLNDPDVKKLYTWKGSDLADLHLTVMKQAGSGYMAYRTVPQYPPVGDRVVIAITSITSGQATAEAAMKSLQQDAISTLEKEGVKINL